MLDLYVMINPHPPVGGRPLHDNHQDTKGNEVNRIITSPLVKGVPKGRGISYRNTLKTQWSNMSLLMLIFMDTPVQHDLNLVSKCGLYCGNCSKYKKGKCAGCVTNEKATWCKTRTCCIENGYDTCADCKTTTPRDCKKFSNFISSIFEVVFRSDRKTSIEYIKEHGRESYINLMVDQNRMVIKK